MKKNLLWIFVFFGLTACSDFLEPKSESLFTPRDASSLDEMLLGEAYPRNTSSNTVLNAGLQLLDDDISCTPLEGTIASDEPKINAMRYMFSWQPDMFERAAEGTMFYKGIWEAHYRFLLGANSVLDYVDGVSGTYNEKALLKAQAYALRGFYFFNLVNIFGEPYNHNKTALGIPLKLTAGMENKDVARSTVEEVYDRVIKDLDEAEKLYLELPENLRYRPDLRVNLPMVQLLKSRVYLYMENWKEAAKYAREVIEKWDFSLIDLNQLTPSTGTRTYYPFIAQESPEVIWLLGSPTQDIMNYYSFSITEKITSKSRRILNASPDFLKCFKEGDLRKEWYVYREQNFDDTFLAYGKNVASFYGNSLEPNKFSQAFRLSEAYLNLSEAAALDKDEVTALWALNQLRAKRFTPEAPNREVSGITGSALVEKIREERRIELCYEFHRWYDLRRYGMPSIKHVWNSGKGNIEYILLEKDPGYTLPIPKVVMNQNRALKQNTLAKPR